MNTPRIFLGVAVSLVLASTMLFAQSKPIHGFESNAAQWHLDRQAVGAAANNVFLLEDYPDEYVEGSSALAVTAKLRGYGASWGATDAQWTFPTPVNLSGYDDIRFAVKILTPPSHIGTKVAGSRAIQFVVDLYDSVFYQGAGNIVLWRYTAGTGDYNIFYYPHKQWISPTATGWFEVVIPMSALRFPNWYTPQADGILHKNHIVKIGFGVDGDSTAPDSIKFLIDDLRATTKSRVVQLSSCDDIASALVIGAAATTPPNRATASDFPDEYVEGQGSLLVDVALRAMVASWGTWTDYHYTTPAHVNATGATELRFSYKVHAKSTTSKALQFVVDLFDTSSAGPGGPWRWADGYGQYGLFASGLENVFQDTWTEVAIPIKDLSFPSWAPDPDGTLNLESLIGFGFGIDGDSSGFDSVQVLLDDFHFTKLGGPTSVKELPTSGVPVEFRVEQNYPNPFNPATKIVYALGQSGKVTLKIYNITGQLVQTVLEGVDHAAGKYEVDVNMNKLSSGAYFYVLQQGANRQARPMMLLK